MNMEEGVLEGFVDVNEAHYVEAESQMVSWDRDWKNVAIYLDGQGGVHEVVFMGNNMVLIESVDLPKLEIIVIKNGACNECKKAIFESGLVGEY